MTRVRAHLWPVALAVVVGFVLLPIAQTEYETWASDRAIETEQNKPALQMSGTLVRRTDAAVVVHITGFKLRKCEYGGVSATVIDEQGVAHAANLMRVDGVRETGRTLDIGYHDLGNWQVWPVAGKAVFAIVIFDSICRGVSVRSVVARVKL